MTSLKTRTGPVVDVAGSSVVSHAGLPVGAVRLTDGFWATRHRTVVEASLPLLHQRLEEAGVLSNFAMTGDFRGPRYADSDLYKWLEAASWALASAPRPELARLVDSSLDLIEAAQLPDGYVNTYFVGDRAGRQWTDVAGLNEFYVAGHLFHAAVAHQRATGEERLVRVAQRMADHMHATFGPAPHQRHGIDGHPGVEMALVELARQTGQRRYAELARYFLDLRGHCLVGGTPYNQDEVPLRERPTVDGHAVCAMYLCAGAADVHAELTDQRLFDALRRLWEDLTTRKMYVSGGLGSRWLAESVGAAYELPNARAYAETCAAIGNVMWNWRMLLLTGESRYADLMELALYNGALAGISLDGRTFFYQNPLADDGTHRRQPWFDIACCPPNLARLLTSLPGYLYGVAGSRVWLHLYAAGEAEIALADGRVFRLVQQTGYPWDGEVQVEVDGAGALELSLRIPGWCDGDASVTVNGQRAPAVPSADGYVTVSRSWSTGDTLSLTLPMRPRLLQSHPYVVENVGRVALMRGPLLYCLEQPDNPGMELRDVTVATDAPVTAQWVPELLGGVVALDLPATVRRLDPGWEDTLYRRAPAPAWKPTRPGGSITVRAVPYHRWANRQPGRMQVWIQTS